MPRALADIFAAHPGVEALEVVSSDDGGPTASTIMGGG